MTPRANLTITSYDTTEMVLQNSKAPMDTPQKFSEKCLINSTAKKATVLDLEYQKVLPYTT